MASLPTTALTLHGLWRMLLATATALLFPFTRNAPPALCCAAAKVLWKRRCNRLKWAPSWNAVSPLRKSSRAKSCWNAIRLTALMISGSPLPESSALRGRATNTNSHAKCRWASRSPCALKQGYRRRRSPSMANQPARLPVNLFTTVPSGVKESKRLLSPAGRTHWLAIKCRARKIEWMRIGKVPGNRGKKGLA